MNEVQPPAAKTEIAVMFNAYTPSEALMDAASLAFRANVNLVELAHGQHPGQYFATVSGPEGLEHRVAEHLTVCTNLEVVSETGPTTPLWRSVRGNPSGTGTTS